MVEERRDFEDPRAGEEFITPLRTITESDVMMNAGLTGDFEGLHVSEEFARTTEFGRRVPHGPLGLVLLDGIKMRRSIVTEVKTMGSLGWTWGCGRPLHFGDTVHARLVVKNKRRTCKGNRGILVIQGERINQASELIQKGENRMMVHCCEAQ